MIDSNFQKLPLMLHFSASSLKPCHNENTFHLRSFGNWYRVLKVPSISYLAVVYLTIKAPMQLRGSFTFGTVSVWFDYCTKVSLCHYNNYIAVSESDSDSPKDEHFIDDRMTLD